MKFLYFSLIGLVSIFSALSLHAQPGKNGAVVISTANTTVNRYSALAANANRGNTTVTAASIATLALTPGDLVLLIQMQGADVNTSNTASYGEITAYNSAGLYEYAYVTGVAGSTITLSCGIKHDYSSADGAQIIYVPQYTSLNVQSGASIIPQAWNGSTGGVVAIHATGTVTQNGTIHADAFGFRGGTRENNSIFSASNITTDYVTTSSSISAEKGESIAGSAADYDLLGGRYGRGAIANGGGGGNNHNSGGGGGANANNGATWNGSGVMCTSCSGSTAWTLDPAYIANGNALTTSSGGGRGGYTYSTANQDARFVAPSDTRWGGDYRDPVGGLGGRPLLTAAEARIFLGGGGGAGDGNNNANSDAGDGGGIVYIIANQLTGTGIIRSNGQNAPSTSGGHNDAPGGAGAGGSILLKVPNIANSITLQANGGRGGDQLISGSEAEGPGGGGGGGLIALIPGSTPTMSVAGGANGTTTSSSVTEFPANGATQGATGQIATLSDYFPPFSHCSIDTDNDGIVDVLDLDDDNDGISDTQEFCGPGATNFACLATVLNDNAGNALDPQADEDGDGIPNYQDARDDDGGSDFVNTCTDTNSDGICDALPQELDNDGDGIPNALDLDNDNDGISDLVENSNGSTTADIGTGSTLDGQVGTGGIVDENKNGIDDAYETATVQDADNDGIPNYLDLDADNDGIPDYLEGVATNGINTSGGQPTGSDTNQNGIIDSYENLQADNTSGGGNSGVNPNDDSDDSDGTPDFLDTDSDGDGAFDWSEAFDANNTGGAVDDLMALADIYNANFPGTFDNTADADSDGIPDWLDNSPTPGYIESTPPPFLDPTSTYYVDADKDGLIDLFDPSITGGTETTLPNSNGMGDADWRDTSSTPTLPIFLLDFIAQAQAPNQVHLLWHTASEENSAYIQIERASDGISFQVIGQVQAAGNSQTNTRYEFVDKQPHKGTNYYRLRLVDLDGSVDFSELRVVQFDASDIDIRVYPNPSAGKLNIDLPAEASKTTIEVSLFDGLGRRVQTYNAPVLGGNFSLDLSALSAGNYVLRVKGDAWVHQRILTIKL